MILLNTFLPPLINTTPTTAISILIILCFYVAYIASSWAFCTHTPRPTLFTDISHCKDLLRSSTLKSRALTNYRLVVAFGIESPITTSDRHFHDLVVLDVKNTLSFWDTDLQRAVLVAEAKSFIKQYILERNREGPSGLEQLVQTLVIQILLKMFYPDIPAASISDIEILAQNINELWKDSKSPLKVFYGSFFPFRLFLSLNSRKLRLHRKLNEMFPTLGNGQIPSRVNPLNVLLPAYMGMWKATWKVFVEVGSRVSEGQGKEWDLLFQDFLKNPSEQAWSTKTAGKVSVQSIVAETLRLYPSTRRIYRNVRTHFMDIGAIEGVDVEGLHRLEGVWGAQPLEFDPSRWDMHGMTMTNKREYMPFGRFGKEIGQCPSLARGGPKLMGILGAALLGVLKENEWEFIKDDGGPAIGTRLT